ncbi:MAG: hypothetical protein JW950_10185 [Deltaproteobacteria bacterium]|nr:hypothetical protein [Deltaproteobacteria bacterium]
MEKGKASAQGGFKGFPPAGKDIAAPRIDPLFGLKTPLVFAHRGGAGEAPESTEEAFRHAAIQAGVDVLEIDLQVVKDREIVVWHGPELDNVHDGARLLTGSDIRDMDFHAELKDRAWVVHPNRTEKLEKSTERRLLTLEDFLGLLKTMERELKDAGRPRILQLNIELKEGKGKCATGAWMPVMAKLFDLLDRENPERGIVLAGAAQEIVDAIRAEISRRKARPYVANVSPEEQLGFHAFMSDGIHTLLFCLYGMISLESKDPPPGPYAFETYYRFCSRDLVERIRADGGGLYPFLTEIEIFPAVDTAADDRLKTVLKELIDLGVDGVMTDYPAKVVRVLRSLDLRE